MEILFYATSIAAAGWLAAMLAKRLSPPVQAAVWPAPRVEISAAAILAPHAAALEATRRSKLDIALVPMAEDDVMASKVGGRAYWPEGTDYPHGSDGQPLHLLAQIDFGATPRLGGYPDNGLLQFFIAANDSYGADFDSGSAELDRQRNYRVVYWPAPLKAAARTPGLSSGTDLPMDPGKPRRMRLTSGSEIMGAGDAGIAAILGTEVYPLAEEYAKQQGLSEDVVVDALYSELLRAGHKLGGYPYFTQEDPRRAEDPRRLLLQLDTDDQMMWGDAGVANFFIDPVDLARGDFSRVMYNWDCH